MILPQGCKIVVKNMKCLGNHFNHTYTVSVLGEWLSKVNLMYMYTHFTRDFRFTHVTFDQQYASLFGCHKNATRTQNIRNPEIQIDQHALKKMSPKNCCCCCCSCLLRLLFFPGVLSLKHTPKI